MEPKPPGAPIFIIGTERSGSNLLRLILDSHSNIVIPHPPHVVRYFTPLAPRYGDLAVDAHFRTLVDDILALVHAHIHPWPWTPTASALVAAAPERSVLGVYLALHELLREHAKKHRWGCKSTFMVHQVGELRKLVPHARFLWLYRDPRDVAASSRKSVFSTFHPAYTARLWDEQQRAALAAEPGGGVLRVRYERLVDQPEETLREICEFIGEAFEPGMLRWFEREEANVSAGLSESWKNTAAPMQKDRLARYRRDLSPTEIADVEGIAGETMQQLGYSLDFPAGPQAGVLKRGGWWLGDWASWARVEARSIRRDKNVWKRWQRWVVMSRIKLRLAILGR